MEHQTPIDDIKTCLTDASFPCSKTDLVNICQQHGASPEVLDTLRQARGERFQSMDEVVKACEDETADLEEPFDYYGWPIV